jgi:hypothetical protein
MVAKCEFLNLGAQPIVVQANKLIRNKLIYIKNIMIAIVEERLIQNNPLPLAEEIFQVIRVEGQQVIAPAARAFKSIQDAPPCQV